MVLGGSEQRGRWSTITFDNHSQNVVAGFACKPTHRAATASRPLLRGALMPSTASAEPESTDPVSANGGVRGRLDVLVLLVLMVVLSACGSPDDTASEVDQDAAAATGSDDHDGDDHDGDDHDDDDHDGDDHDDDDHDDDHDDGGSAGLDAHEHGSADLSVAWVGSDIVIDLISPTQNVFGFEYEPESDEDLATATERTEAITADGVVAINDQADCDLTEPASTEIERDGSHSEITVSWTFSCGEPAEISEVDFSSLFAAFPGFEDIDAEWVSETNQSSAELSPAETTLRLQP